MAEQQASDSVAPRSKEMVDTMVHADWQSSLDSDQDYQQLEDIVEQYRSTHGVQAIEESKHLITKRFNNKKLRKNPNRLIKQLKAEASKIKKSSSETRENLENDKTERFKTVPSQEIEDLFSNPVFGEKTRNEETVLSHWKQFMTRNCITETQFKSIVQDYNRMSVRPKTVSKRREVAQNPELNIKPLARRFDYSTKVSQLGSK